MVRHATRWWCRELVRTPDEEEEDDNDDDDDDDDDDDEISKRIFILF